MADIAASADQGGEKKPSSAPNAAEASRGADAQTAAAAAGAAAADGDGNDDNGKEGKAHQGSAGTEPRVLYQDSRVTIDEEGITIHTYYFPFGNKKRLTWKQIKLWYRRKAELFHDKHWGMGPSGIWFAWSHHRMGEKDAASFVLRAHDESTVSISPPAGRLAHAAVAVAVVAASPKQSSTGCIQTVRFVRY